MSAEQIAEHFHVAYIQLAPRFGWGVQDGTEKGWDALPEANRQLMTAVVEHLIFEGAIHDGYACWKRDDAVVERDDSYQPLPQPDDSEAQVTDGLGNRSVARFWPDRSES